MNPWLYLKGEWISSRQGILALALILALAVSLGIGVSVVDRALRQGMSRAGDDFALLAGAPGSSISLILGSVYLRPENLPLMPAASLAQAVVHSGVVWAAPLAFGDRFGNSPMVGTSSPMLTLGGKRPLAQGRVFSAMDEAVVGSAVSLAMESSFTPQHGLIAVPDPAQDAHNHSAFTVVGRLPATGTPWDNAILVPIEAIWDTHNLLPEELEHAGLLGPEAYANNNLPGISAMVIQPRTVADAYKLRNLWNSSSTQAAFTGEVLTSLFATLGDVRGVIQAMALGSQIVALASAMLAAVFAVALRRNTLGLLRALGAPRAYLLCCVWLLVTFTLLLGGLGGLALGLLLAKIAALWVQAASGIALPVSLSLQEFQLLAAFLVCGSLCALLPAALTRKGAFAG